MISRVFKAKIADGRYSDFQINFRKIALPLIKSHDGLLSLSAGRLPDDADHDFMLVTNWESLEHVKAFAGDNWQEPLIPSGMDTFMEEVWLDHYDLFEHA